MWRKRTTGTKSVESARILNRRRLWNFRRRLRNWLIGWRRRCNWWFWAWWLYTVWWFYTSWFWWFSRFDNWRGRCYMRRFWKRC